MIGRVQMKKSRESWAAMLLLLPVAYLIGLLAYAACRLEAPASCGAPDGLDRVILALPSVAVAFNAALENGCLAAARVLDQTRLALASWIVLVGAAYGLCYAVLRLARAEGAGPPVLRLVNGMALIGFTLIVFERGAGVQPVPLALCMLAALFQPMVWLRRVLAPRRT